MASNGGELMRGIGGKLLTRREDRAFVLETGKIALQGTCDELTHNDQVRAAYLDV